MNEKDLGSELKKVIKRTTLVAPLVVPTAAIIAPAIAEATTPKCSTGVEVDSLAKEPHTIAFINPANGKTIEHDTINPGQHISRRWTSSSNSTLNGKDSYIVKMTVDGQTNDRWYGDSVCGFASNLRVDRIVKPSNKPVASASARPSVAPEPSAPTQSAPAAAGLPRAGEGRPSEPGPVYVGLPEVHVNRGVWEWLGIAALGGLLVGLAVRNRDRLMFWRRPVVAEPVVEPAPVPAPVAPAAPESTRLGGNLPVNVNIHPVNIDIDLNPSIRQ